MKALICFALIAVASAIPLQDPQVVIIPDGPIPIPMEMLRSGAFMPVWRDFPQMPDLPIPERNLRDLPNFKISEVQFLDMPDIQAVYAIHAPSEIVPEAVKIVDLPELSLADLQEVVPQVEDIVPEPVNVVEYFEPANVANEVVPAAEEIVPFAEEVAPQAEDIVPEPVNVVEYFEPANVANEVVPAAEEIVPFAEEVAPQAEDIVPEPVNVVEYFEPADVANEVVPAAEEIVPFAEEIVPQGEEIVPEPVNVVEYFEPVGADVLAPELPASEDAEMRFVKFVDSPATFDLKNARVPIDAHDIV